MASGSSTSDEESSRQQEQHRQQQQQPPQIQQVQQPQQPQGRESEEGDEADDDESDDDDESEPEEEKGAAEKDARQEQAQSQQPKTNAERIFLAVVVDDDVLFTPVEDGIMGARLAVAKHLNINLREVNIGLKDNMDVGPDDDISMAAGYCEKDCAKVAAQVKAHRAKVLKMLQGKQISVQLMNGDVVNSPVEDGVEEARKKVAAALELPFEQVRLVKGSCTNVCDLEDLVECEGPLMAVAVPDYIEKDIANMCGLDELNELANMSDSTFSLQGRNLPRLPASLARVLASRTSPVHDLDVARNDLASIPNSFCELLDLENLDVSQNRLRNFPPSLGDLEALDTLVASDNDLIELPESIGKLTWMRLLNLADNRLASLPPSLGQCSALITLNLEANDLRSLPETLAGLKHLQFLLLGKNKLTQLFDGIGKLKSLKHLMLARNQIEELPSDIGTMKELEDLDISFNRLKDVPENMWYMNPLVKVDVSGNFEELTERLEALWRAGMRLKF